MKINKDLIIEDTDKTLEDLNTNITTLDNKIKPYVLFENDSGATSGTITYNGETVSFADFDYVEIYVYLSGQIGYNIIKLYDPNSKTGGFTGWGWGDTVYFYRILVTCQDNTWKAGTTDMAYVYGGDTAAVGHRTVSSYSVRKIVGYKNS